MILAALVSWVHRFAGGSVYALVAAQVDSPHGAYFHWRTYGQGHVFIQPELAPTAVEWPPPKNARPSPSPKEGD